MPVTPKPKLSETAKRNGRVHPAKVNDFIRVVNALQERGLLVSSGYKLSHPLNGGRSLTTRSQSEPQNAIDATTD